MKTAATKDGNRGFTLAEMMVGLAVLAAVGALAYSMLLNSSTLFAKNVSLNSSNTTLRSALDQMYADINQAYGMPKLINADGTTANPSQPAAGILFDRYIGGPYVITTPSPISAAATSFTMKCWAGTTTPDTLLVPATPALNDVVCLDNSTTRPRVSSCAISDSSGVRTLTVSLATSPGTSISWTAGTTETAYAVHKKAYVVATVNGRGELRLYNNAETVANYNDPANYVVLTRELSGQTTNNENTPFSVSTQSGNQFLNIAMRVEDPKLNNYLSAKQKGEFNTFFRVDTMLRPRNTL